MELSVYNIKGEVTDKKVTLDDSIFGIEPNNHVIWLDVNSIWPTGVRVRISQKREAKLPEVHASSFVRRGGVAVHAEEILNLLFWSVAGEFLALNQGITDSR